MDRLDELESQSVFILREAFARSSASRSCGRSEKTPT